MEKIVRLEARSGDHGKGLKVRLHSGGLKAEALVALNNHVRCPRQALGAVAPAIHGRNGQVFDVIQVALAGRLGVTDTGCAKRKGKSKP